MRLTTKRLFQRVNYARSNFWGFQIFPITSELGTADKKKPNNVFQLCACVYMNVCGVLRHRLKKHDLYEYKRKTVSRKDKWLVCQYLQFLLISFNKYCTMASVCSDSLYDRYSRPKNLEYRFHFYHAWYKTKFHRIILFSIAKVGELGSMWITGKKDR